MATMEIDTLYQLFQRWVTDNYCQEVTSADSGKTAAEYLLRFHQPVSTSKYLALCCGKAVGECAFASKLGGVDTIVFVDQDQGVLKEIDKPTNIPHIRKLSGDYIQTLFDLGQKNEKFDIISFFGVDFIITTAEELFHAIEAAVLALQPNGLVLIYHNLPPQDVPYSALYRVERNDHSTTYVRRIDIDQVSM